MQHVNYWGKPLCNIDYWGKILLNMNYFGKTSNMDYWGKRLCNMNNYVVKHSVKWSIVVKHYATTIVWSKTVYRTDREPDIQGKTFNLSNCNETYMIYSNQSSPYDCMQ